jgi:hypothetical protein
MCRSPKRALVCRYLGLCSTELVEGDCMGARLRVQSIGVEVADGRIRSARKSV